MRLVGWDAINEMRCARWDELFSMEWNALGGMRCALSDGMRTME